MLWVGLRPLPAGVLLVVAIIALTCGDDGGLPGADTAPVRIGRVEFRGEVTSGLTDNTLRVAVEDIKEGRAAALRQLLDCSTVTVDIAIADLEGGLPQEGDSVEVEGNLLDSCIVDAVEVEIK